MSETKYFLITTAYDFDPIAHYAIEIKFYNDTEDWLWYDGLNWSERCVPEEIINNEFLTKSNNSFDYPHLTQHLYDLDEKKTKVLNYDEHLTMAITCLYTE